jgi:hypothetical protein
MTPLNFAIVGLRLFAIYFFIESLPLFSGAALIGEFSNQIAGSPQPKVYFAALIPGGSLLLMAALLFIFAPSLARRLAPPAANESEKIVCSFEELQAIIFAAVGILILSNALPNAGRALQYFFSWYQDQQEGGATSPKQALDISMYNYYVGVLAQLVIGLLLLLRPKGFRKIWRWLRTAGTPPVE